MAQEAAMKILVGFLLGLIALPVLFGVAAIAGLLSTNSTATPPGWERFLAMSALDRSLEHRATGLKNPIAPNDRSASVAGAKLYEGCSGCHGDIKGPSSWGTSDFYPRAPQFYQEGADVTPEEAYAAVHDGIRYSGMAAWGDQIPASDIWKVANFVSRIRRLPPAALKAGRPH
jgi:mono/diheme cytochrome c family protein